MEKQERMILELFLGLIFVAIIGLICVVVLYMPGISKSSGQTISNVVSNSYNTNSFNQNPKPVYSENKIVVISRDYNEKYHRSYTDDEKEAKFLDYSSYGEHSMEKTIFSNYKDEFRVHVVNKDYKSGYFGVEFHFCDYYDNCFSRTIKKYISSKEEETFSYVDVHEDKYKYYDWGYKVFPEEISTNN
jgi:hypothetical protein